MVQESFWVHETCLQVDCDEQNKSPNFFRKITSYFFHAPCKLFGGRKCPRTTQPINHISYDMKKK